MGLEQPRDAFNHLVYSMILVVVGMLLLSGVNVKNQTTSYTGQFSLGPMTFFIALIISILGVGIVMLITGLGKISK